MVPRFVRCLFGDDELLSGVWFRYIQWRGGKFVEGIWGGGIDLLDGVGTRGE